MSDLHIRIVTFTIAFAILASLEIIQPRRRSNAYRKHRWAGSWVIFLIGAFVARILVPGGLAALAMWAHINNIGIFNFVSLNQVFEFVIAIIVLDLAVWAQHYVTHKIPFLWRLHRVHHSDIHVDVTTALRFHPLEILFSILWKVVIVISFGFSALAVLWFEIILNASAQFNHSNIRIPTRLDKVLRLFIVTPDMHRVHHSVDELETSRNFGFFLSVWDKLLRTYKTQPELGHEKMEIGQKNWRELKDQRAISLLVRPFARDN